MPILLKVFAAILTLLCIGAITLAWMGYCYYEFTQLDQKSVERRAQELARAANVTINKSLVVIDETRGGISRLPAPHDSIRRMDNIDIA